MLHRSDGYGHGWLGTPLDTLIAEEKHFEASLAPGAYTVVVESKQHHRLVFPLLLPPGANEEVQIALSSANTTDSATVGTALSSVSWHHSSINPAYQALRDSLLVLEKEQRILIPQTGQREPTKTQLTIYWNRFNSLVEQYTEPFPQVVAENHIINLWYLHPAMIQTLQLNEISTDSVPYDVLFRSDSFRDFMTQLIASVEMLDPKSYLATSEAIPLLVRLDQYLAKSAYLRKTYDLEKDHFHRYVLDYTDAVPSEETAADILFGASYGYLRQPEGADQGTQVLVKLKQRYHESYYVQEGLVDTQLTGLRMTAGQIAPAFAVKTLAGDSITLAGWLGKYVYLDFWGSWCKPCVEELPNLSALATSMEDELQVIGLAQDSEQNLRKFIEKHPLPYPNALAPPAISDYGITSFPTTFLISPDGVIVAKNLRGENVKQQVEDAIRSYEATATENSERDPGQ